MEYTGKLDNVSDEELQAQVMRGGGEPAQQSEQQTPDDLLALVVEEQQKAALANYHLRMQDAGAIFDPKTGQINPNTIEPAIADFAAQEYITNMAKITGQRDSILTNFNLVQSESILTPNDKLMVKQQMVNKESWPMHIGSVRPPTKAKTKQRTMKDELSDYGKMLDLDSSYVQDAKITKGKNRNVPLALLDKKGKVSREATPFEAAEYWANKGMMEQSPIYQLWQKQGTAGTPEESQAESEYSKQDFLNEYKRLGGSRTDAGKKFAVNFGSKFTGK